MLFRSLERGEDLLHAVVLHALAVMAEAVVAGEAGVELQIGETNLLRRVTGHERAAQELVTEKIGVAALTRAGRENEHIFRCGNLQRVFCRNLPESVSQIVARQKGLVNFNKMPSHSVCTEDMDKSASRRTKAGRRGDLPAFAPTLRKERKG